MKKFIYTSLTLALLIAPLSSVSAHPGRTDSNGGHTCRTNCTERWGLEYGEYHYHNGGGSSSSGSGYKAPAAPATPSIQPAKKAPAVVNKLIVAVEAAPIYSVYGGPGEEDKIATWKYGTEVIAERKDEGWIGLAGDLNNDGKYDYLNQNLTTTYQPIKAKIVSVRVQKAYLFNIPSANGYSRGPVEKNEKLNVIGQNGTFWFVKGSNGHGFISKTVAW